MHIKLKPLADDSFAPALKIRCAPEQLEFVEPVENIIQTRRPSEDVHLILADEKIVGLFKIDRDYAAQMDFCNSNELGLRGFVLDSAAQGRGIGRQVSQILSHYLAAAYPDRTSVLLTVNCRNTKAQNAYLKGGFTDTNELYRGGSAGPQHIYRKLLR